MSELNTAELKLLRQLLQAARDGDAAAATTALAAFPVAEPGTPDPLVWLDRKLEFAASKEPGEPDLWVSEQHGTLVSIRGYMTPDTTVYKNWKKAEFLPN
ncbi:hypothetical protein AB4Y45_35690 [Paraburkholderia sp. EG287A]|uniref:hypothetical protein n=1 Tax=Paraburkholderia sp. EG287A TaxID=3237012 RepID=UPI0034D1FA28